MVPTGGVVRGWPGDVALTLIVWAFALLGIWTTAGLIDLAFSHS